MLLAPSRALFILFFLAGSFFLCVSLYLQFGVGLAPCGLAVLQRALLLGGTVVALMAILHGPGKRRWIVYSAACLAVALAGVFTALREVLRQGRGEELRLLLCRPGFVELLDRSAVVDAVKSIPQGAAHCVRVNWTLFELSLSEWTLLLFLMLSLIALYPLIRFFSRF